MRFWIGVVSRQHVLKGVQGGFAQVCHGKKGPLSRMEKDDYLIYYSPRETMGGSEFCQKFTALGAVKTGEVYQVKMSETFHPFRLDIDYLVGEETSIRPLINHLEFSRGGKNWGFTLRKGLFEISEHDFMIIAEAMGISFDNESNAFPSKFDKPCDSPGFMLWRVSNLWQRLQKEALAKLNLTHAQFVLLSCVSYLDSQGKNVNQKELAEFAATDPMMTSQILRHLEKEELIKRKAKDGRSFEISPTKKGKELVKKAIPLVETIDYQFFSSLRIGRETFCEELQELAGYR